MSLCWRCENRAKAHETGHGPRYECTDFEHSKFVCYCYQPVKPVILKRQRGDKRPQFAGWAISARSEFAGVEEDLMLKVIPHGRKGNTLLWIKKP
jgi:hypothetical protein